MTVIDKIYTRSETEKSYLFSNLKRLNNAVKADLFFAIDEYIVSIFNTFFSDNRSISGDEHILKEFIKLSKMLGNDRNAKIINEELNNIENNLNLKNNNNLTFPLKVLLPENLRTELKSLKKITRYYEIEKRYSHHNNDNFDDNKYIDNFDNRFMWNINSYKKNSKETSTSMLDIGTGMGYTPYIFKHNGYDVACFDMVGCQDIFNKSCFILGIEKKDFTIKKFEKIISFNKKFDIINASLICFNQHKQPDVWLKDEWMFFLNDIYENHLNDCGNLHLGFNSEIENKFYLGNDELHNIFDPFINNRIAVLNKNDIKKLLNI